MKKVKFTFWLLGFGCGIALAGIVGTFVALHVQPASVQNASPVKEQEPAKKSIEADETAVNKEQVEQPVEKETAGEDKTISSPVAEKVVQKEIIFKEINIPKADSASEICDLLEQKGFIEDSDDFLDYIRSCGKQRFIKHGKVELPIGAEYADLLQALTVS